MVPPKPNARNARRPAALRPGAATPSADPTYFATAAEFRTWLRRHGATATELLVGFHKLGSGTPSMSWPESVDEALCAGWIDGVRKRVDEARYTIRFTPRKPASHWSVVNIERVRVLTAEGRMRPAGLAAFARRTETRSRRASYEQTHVPGLAPDHERRFRARRDAWNFFEAQAPSYRKRILWWIHTAKQAATRDQRLARVIEACAKRERL